MPLKGIPPTITPELLYVLARMGHGDSIVIADANFPSDSIANQTETKQVLRVHGSTSDLARDILELMPLDQYMESPVKVMDRVESDKAKELFVPAYEALADATGATLDYVERFSFYEKAKTAFAIVQTNDYTLYANVILFKGVIPPKKSEGTDRLQQQARGAQDRAVQGTNGW